MVKIEVKYKSKNLEIHIKENSFSIHTDTLTAIQKIIDFEKSEVKTQV